MKYALLFVGFFLVCQALSALLVKYAMMPFFAGANYDTVVLHALLSTILYSVITLATFMWMKWCPVSGNYISSKPMGVLGLVSLLSLTLILPSTWMLELLPDEWTKDILADTFDKLLRSPEGYIVIGIAAPLVEEVVFRGAILRALLEWMKNSFGELTNKKAWIAIAISAMFFAAIHFNPAQIPHAFFGGLLLGWLYYRTGSIIPGILYHLVNNSVAFLLVWIFPDVRTDARLIEYFGNNDMALTFSVIVSTIVAIPCILLLNRMMKRA